MKKNQMNLRDWNIVKIFVQEGLIMVSVVTLLILISQEFKIYFLLPLVLNIIYLMFINRKIKVIEEAKNV